MKRDKSTPSTVRAHIRSTAQIVKDGDKTNFSRWMAVAFLAGMVVMAWISY